MSFLFFRAWIPWLLFLGGLPLFLKDRKRQLVRRRGRDMQEQFLTGIQLVCTSLQAGYAVENAFGEALKELKKIYSEESFIVSEFTYLTVQTRLNRSIESLLEDLGVDGKTAAADACLMEHAVSPESYKAIKELAKRKKADGDE